MAVGFDLRAPMLVDASASIQPDHSCCGAVMTQGGSSPSRRRSALVLPGFFPIAAAQHENGAHSPTHPASISAGFPSALGRSSIRAVGANAGTIRLARHHLFLDWGADGFSRPVSQRPRDPQTKRPPLRRPFDPCNLSAIRPRLRRLDPLPRRAGAPRSQGLANASIIIAQVAGSGTGVETDRWRWR